MVGGGKPTFAFFKKPGTGDLGNMVNGDILTVVDAAAGVCDWAFDFTTTPAENVASAYWTVWLAKTDGSVKRFTKRQPFFLRRSEVR